MSSHNKYRYSNNCFIYPNINKSDEKKDAHSDEKTGFLEIIVSDAQTGMPVRLADIELYKLTIIGEFAERAISQLIGRYSTNENGEIPLIELPLIEWPEERYFAVMNIFGYYDVTIVNIPIYEDIKTTYHIELHRVESTEPIREYIRTPTRTEYYNPPIWFF